MSRQPDYQNFLLPRTRILDNASILFGPGCEIATYTVFSHQTRSLHATAILCYNLPNQIGEVQQRDVIRATASPNSDYFNVAAMSKLSKMVEEMIAKKFRDEYGF